MKIALQKQNGAALILGLIMLLVMTLIGVTSMNTARTELKIATNFKNHSNAFQTAALMFERALVDPAIAWLSASTTALPGNYTSGNLLKSGTSGIIFIGCRAADTSSLTGSAGKYLVHEISAVGNELNADGAIVGVSRQTAGYKTIAAGCQSP